MTLPAVSLEDGSSCLAAILSRTIGVANGWFSASAENLDSSLDGIS
jgi:hypothetical protein